MNVHQLRRAVLLSLGLMFFGIGFPTLQAQPNNFATSLHATRYGKEWWYRAENGGFENLTNIPISELGCRECHGPTDADGNVYDGTMRGIVIGGPNLGEIWLAEEN